MGSYNTTLGLVNLSGKNIRSTAITIDDASNWDYQKVFVHGLPCVSIRDHRAALMRV
jgi:hypothetical protein